jgi:hypothetical protein
MDIKSHGMYRAINWGDGYGRTAELVERAHRFTSDRFVLVGVTPEYEGGSPIWSGSDLAKFPADEWVLFPPASAQPSALSMRSEDPRALTAPLSGSLWRLPNGQLLRWNEGPLNLGASLVASDPASKGCLLGLLRGLYDLPRLSVQVVDGRWRLAYPDATYIFTESFSTEEGALLHALSGFGVDFPLAETNTGVHV